MVWVQHSHQQKFLPEPKWRTGQTVHFHFLSSENGGGFINQFLKAARTIRHNPSPATYFETLFSRTGDFNTSHHHFFNFWLVYMRCRAVIMTFITQNLV